MRSCTARDRLLVGCPNDSAIVPKDLRIERASGVGVGGAKLDAVEFHHEALIAPRVARGKAWSRRGDVRSTWRTAMAPICRRTSGADLVTAIAAKADIGVFAFEGG